jgi:hypothetical protein
MFSVQYTDSGKKKVTLPAIKDREAAIARGKELFANGRLLGRWVIVFDILTGKSVYTDRW